MTLMSSRLFPTENSRISEASKKEDQASVDRILKPMGIRERFDSTASNSVISASGDQICSLSHSSTKTELSLNNSAESKMAISNEPAATRISNFGLNEKAKKANSICINCQNRFRAQTMHLNGKLCANCFKIYQSIDRTCEQNEGSFRLSVKSPGKVEVVIICSQNHKWRIGMQSRKVKNWCRQCKDQERAEASRIQIERLNQLREEQARQQEDLLRAE